MKISKLWNNGEEIMKGNGFGIYKNAGASFIPKIGH